MMDEVVPFDKRVPRLGLYELELTGVVNRIVNPDEKV